MWARGKPLTQAKKRVYVNEEDYLKYSPELIRRWKELYIVEVYAHVSSNIWELIEKI